MRILLSVLVAAALLIGLSACEESVDVVLTTDRAFTVYGHLSPRTDTQAVRVFAIDGRIDRVRPEPLEARVWSVNVQTGESYSWRDSVIQFAADNFGHIFWSRFRPDYGSHHRLFLERPDGAEAHVEILMPPLSQPELLAPTVEQDYVLLPVLWEQAPRLNNIRVRYLTNMGSFLFAYSDAQFSRPEGQVAIVQVHRDVRFVFREILRRGGSTRDTRLMAIEQLLLVSSADWAPPGEVFDPELLVEPGTFSNVENGFGFVGAGYEASFYYEVPDSIAMAAGFFVSGRLR